MARKNCQAQLKRVDHNLAVAIEHADRRGYTGMMRSKGSALDDPRVKALMRKRDVLLQSCTYSAVKRGGRWRYHS